MEKINLKKKNDKKIVQEVSKLKARTAVCDGEQLYQKFIKSVHYLTDNSRIMLIYFL